MNKTILVLLLIFWGPFAQAQPAGKDIPHLDKLKKKVTVVTSKRHRLEAIVAKLCKKTGLRFLKNKSRRRTKFRSMVKVGAMSFKKKRMHNALLSLLTPKNLGYITTRKGTLYLVPATHKRYKMRAKKLSDAIPREQEPPAEPKTTSPKATYAIISEETHPKKRVINIRLSRKANKAALQVMAHELHQSLFPRTFIFYYLPGQKVGRVAWATSHFNPKLQIAILGLTEEEEQKLLQPTNVPGTVLGRWFDNVVGVENTITLCRDNAKLFILVKHRDGSSGKKEVIETPHTFGKKYTEKTPNSFGEYYVLDAKGNLQLWDSQGLIRTALKIK